MGPTGEETTSEQKRVTSTINHVIFVTFFFFFFLVLPVPEPGSRVERDTEDAKTQSTRQNREAGASASAIVETGPSGGRRY